MVSKYCHGPLSGSKYCHGPLSGSKNCHGPPGYSGIDSGYIIVTFMHQTPQEKHENVTKCPKKEINLGQSYW